ncbi:MAG: hypothetical protein E6Q97_24870 [Desulfurellales bacterium]|nr:MAG: hypothetical protein E6Q97_24870 [Desulfurellales bacterium]
MAEVLLLNPRGRRKARKARRRNPATPSPAQRRARAAFAAAARARRRSPVIASNPRRRRRARRSNPIGAYRRVTRRQSNPINVNGLIGLAKQGAIMGAGAVVADMAYAQIAKFLPANLQAGPGQVTVGSVVKLLLTAAAGQMLSRATRGMSRQAALGAIVVQSRDIVAGLMPAGTVSGRLGYAVNAPVIPYNGRVGPGRLGAYVSGGTPLLSGRLGAYEPFGAPSPLLSGRASARDREGFGR